MQQEAGWRKLWQAEAVLGHFHVRPVPATPLVVRSACHHRVLPEPMGDTAQGDLGGSRGRCAFLVAMASSHMLCKGKGCCSANSPCHSEGVCFPKQLFKEKYINSAKDLKRLQHAPVHSHFLEHGSRPPHAAAG